jgi:hypothetical protein
MDTPLPKPGIGPRVVLDPCSVVGLADFGSRALMDDSAWG